MTEVSILLSVKTRWVEMLHVYFVMKSSKKFLAEPLAATRGTPVEKHCSGQLRLAEKLLPT